MNVILGDGSFEDYVQLGIFADTSEEALNQQYFENNSFHVLSKENVPAVVADYVGSVVYSFDIRLSEWCSMSEAVVAERLRKDYVRDEIVSRNMTYEFSKYFSSFGKRLYHYKLFESMGSEARVDRNMGYANHQIRMALSRDLRVGLRTLQDLANSSTPVDVVTSNFEINFDSKDCVFRSVFFNKNLSFNDVLWLWDSMEYVVNGFFQGFRHVFLLQAVLLRHDWSEDELRSFFTWWKHFSSVLDQRLTGEELRNEFRMLSNSVKVLFSANPSTPVDLLLSLFDDGDENVQLAVVRNPAVGEDFVSDVINGSVVDSSVIRESALLSSSTLDFEQLMKIFEDKEESAGIRFAALFNGNVPPFMRPLYSLWG